MVVNSTRYSLGNKTDCAISRFFFCLLGGAKRKTDSTLNIYFNNNASLFGRRYIL